MNIVHQFAYKISAWNRQRKWQFFKETCSFDKHTRILDVGFSDEEHSSSDNFLEKHYPFLHNITALSIEDTSQFQKRYPEVTAVTYDGKTFPFDDTSFDIIWSNAVIEHVGDRKNQLYFLQEMLRVGKKIYMTTPNKFSPVEVHTRIPLLHILLSKKLFDAFLNKLGKTWATGDYMHLLGKKDIEKMLHELGQHNFRIKKNKLCGFTLDFVIIIDPV